VGNCVAHCHLFPPERTTDAVGEDCDVRTPLACDFHGRTISGTSLRATHTTSCTQSVCAATQKPRSLTTSTFTIGCRKAGDLHPHPHPHPHPQPQPQPHPTHTHTLPAPFRPFLTRYALVYSLSSPPPQALLRKANEVTWCVLVATTIRVGSKCDWRNTQCDKLEKNK
jgi:hypothetical protein